MLRRAPSLCWEPETRCFNAAGTDAGALTLVTGGTGIDLTVNMDATMSSGPSVGSASYTFTDGLTLNGTLTAEGLRGYTATLGFTGSQTVDGTGTIQLVEKKDGGPRVGRRQLRSQM